MRAEHPAAAPELLFAYWTTPDLLTRWWPQAAEIDPRPGGAYHLAWLGMGWHLRGTYTTFELPRRLAFFWQWDHAVEPGPTRLVTIDLAPSPEGGTILTLTHGPYAATAEDQALRVDDHLAGWRHFLPHLDAAILVA